MLVAIDLQNDTFDASGSSYGEWTEKIKNDITARIQKAIDDNESIIYTKNLYPEFEHDRRSTESIRFDETIYPEFFALLENYGDEYVKTFYGIPPEEAKKIQEEYQEEVETNQTIEFIGVETNICILANLMVIQNIFPQADITVNKDLVGSSNEDLHDKTLEVLKNMNVIIK
ncbi:cysteine hydrolase family protein [Salinicoccus sp. HZC-1]|uniref:cysteine hydrolase family protein n=1 Tax=Salinicoccus sp. HZC-1 TaxID=3385497 RepID=UPI00398A88F3